MSRIGDESAARESLDPVLSAGGDEGGREAGGARMEVPPHPPAMIGLGFLVFMFSRFVLVHFAKSPTISTSPIPTMTSGPSWSHPFGTDPGTRDALSRVLHGGQVSLKVALGIAMLSTLIGVVIGALAGFYRGWFDSVLMRFTDLWIALPAIPFLAVAVSIGTVDLGPLGDFDLGSPAGITVLLSLLLWGSIARVVRGATLALREREFVDAAAVGVLNTRIIVRHVIPNCAGPT
jgi:peptide/nickel transport system permease protein